MNILIIGLIALAVIFAITSVIGLLRMQDSYLRMQSSTIISTIVVVLVIVAAILYEAIYVKNLELCIKLGVLGLFYIITSPIAGHAIAKGAYHHGVKMTDKHVCDKYGEDMENDN